MAKELESLCLWGTPLSCTCLSTDGSHKEKKGGGFSHKNNDQISMSILMLLWEKAPHRLVTEEFDVSICVSFV